MSNPVFVDGRTMHRAALLGLSACVGALLGGCRVTRPNPDHCYYAAGDRTCMEADPARPWCAGPGCGELSAGCVTERPPDACYSPCGGGSGIAEDTSCIELAEDSESSGESGEAGGADLSSDACELSEECPEQAPYCLMGSCRPCDEVPDPALACFELSGGSTPVCLDGACVECDPSDALSCDDGKLLCDAATLTCVPCSAHNQCAGGAGCDLALGECLPHDAVLHVGDGGQEHSTLAAALAALDGGSGTLIVHALDGPGYTEGVAISGDRALAVFAAPGELPVLAAAPVSLEVLDGARLYARGLVLNGDSAALVSGARLELDAVRLAPALTSCLTVDDGILHMRNSMMRSSLSDAPVVAVAGVSELDIRYSTLVGLGPVATIACPGATIVPGSRVRNSVLANFGDAPAVECASPAYEHNGLEDATGFAGNTTLGELQPDWFVDLLLADLHLALGAPIGLVDAAVWSEGDPVVDVDGDPRPTVDGSPDFAGADRLP